MFSIPHMAASSDIQQNYRKIFDKAKATNEPIVIMSRNEPDVAVVSIELLTDLYSKQEAWEMQHAMNVLAEYEQEKSAGTLQELHSLEDLMK